MNLLEGRVAAVTGGAQGIGLAIAQTFASHGARVVIGDLDDVKAKAAAQEIGTGCARGTGCDVVSVDDVRALADLARDTFGGLDIWVNNAGITRDAIMWKMTETQFDEVIDVHLKGTWNGIRAAAEVMRPRKRGSIINMSSISGKIGLPGQTNYSAAKAGVIGLTKSAAKELARHSVRVNAIQPGLIRSAMTRALAPEVWESKVKEVPLGRAGEPDEVAGVALFYASDLSSYMTGTTAEVTGGRAM
ncbi:3-oxoacyl-ACP reductase FabG [Actinomadura chibensis]|uniref:3-oxoacyl-ACP reductase FabG n=1 Tax=Actinomadura chibensis TaxID=392828 RepID=A0A5D0NVG0_9ACTN|nr:3-oxoacyl-ACP reductase FabG [Actinomadura chibensis]TYB48232.1 3-oxoacyl-ACP reductase FabG [Actinomadura chibensis]